MSETKTSANDLLACEQTFVLLLRHVRYLVIDQTEEVVGQFIDDETTTVKTIIERMKESDTILDDGWNDLRETFAIATPFVTIIKTCKTQNPGHQAEISALLQAYQRLDDLMDSLLSNQLVS